MSEIIDAWTDDDGPSGITVWRIDGQAACDSGGGTITVYASTLHDCLVPDVDEAIQRATNGRYSWYRIDSVERVGQSLQFSQDQEKYHGKEIHHTP